MDNQIVKTASEDVIRISSREVADMMEYSRHGDLIEKIENINKVFENGKVRYQEYWIESSYKVEGNNKSYKEYLITKRGCEFIANKSTGEKGVIFTHKYMEKFEEMERHLY
ncbi:MAG: Rha family transcriptional regulator, partial [Bacilli bacterium]